MKFYKCPVCGNICYLMEGNIDNIRCCGTKMEELIANKTEASLEKHVPVYEKVGNNIEVKVGEVEHPMTTEHYIMFIAQVFENKVNIVKLTPQDKPKATFDYIKGAKIYEYCNIHGLWVKDVE